MRESENSEAKERVRKCKIRKSFVPDSQGQLAPLAPQKLNFCSPPGVLREIIFFTAMSKICHNLHFYLKKRGGDPSRRPACMAGLHGSCLVSVSTGQQHCFAFDQSQGKHLLSCEAFQRPSDMHFFPDSVGTTTLHFELLSTTTYMSYLILMKLN